MAQITWRNVEAPDFRGVQGSLNASSQMLQNAATGWGQYERTQEVIANSELNRANVTQQMSQQDYLYQRLRTDNDAMDAASPAIQALLVAGQRGDQIGQQAALSDLQKAGLRPDQFAGVLSNAGKLNTTALTDAGLSLGNDVQAQSLLQIKDAFGQTRQARDRLAKVTSSIANVTRGAMTFADAEKLMPKEMEGMSPEEQLLFRGEVARRFPNATAAPSGASGASPLLAQAAGQRATAVPGLAPTSNPLMDTFINGLAKLETAGGAKTIKSGGKDSNNLFNIKDFSGTGSGFQALDKAEGSNDRYRTYASPEESRADLMDLLARKYPAALTAKTPEEFATALKAGGYATDPDYVKKLTGAIGDTSNLAATPTSTAGPTTGGDRAATLMQKVALNEQLNAGITADYVSTLGSTKADVDVVEDLRKNVLVGWSDREALKKIQEVQAMGKEINPEMAVSLIKRSMVGAGSDPFAWGSPSTWNPFSSSKREVDAARLKSNVELLQNGGIDRNVLTAEQTKENQQTLTAASKAATDASAEYNTYKQRVESGVQPELAWRLPELKKKAEESNVLYQTLLTQQRSDSTQNSARYQEQQRKLAKEEADRKAAEEKAAEAKRKKDQIAADRAMAEKAGVGGGFKPGKGSFVEQALGSVANGMLDKIQ